MVKIGRHGDVGLDGGERAKPIPKDAVKLDPKVCRCDKLDVCAKHGVLAHGEVTGHTHRFTNGEIELYEKDGQFWVKTLTEATIKHEEHSAITVQPGTYEVVYPQVFNPLTEEMERARD